MITPRRRKQLNKAIEKMNPTPESVQALRNHYEIYTFRHMTTASLPIGMGFVFLGFYIVSITTPFLDVAYGREWVFGVSGVTSLLLGLPFLLVARSNNNANRRVR